MGRRSLGIALLIAGVVLAASGLTAAPAARSAAAADIRTTPLLDDFDRPNENPLSGVGSWAKADASSQAIQLLDNRVTLAAGGLARYQWTPTAVDGDVEVWARYAGAGMDDGAAAELVIVTDVGGSNQLDGYALRALNTFGGAGWEIRRLQNWSPTVIASSGFGPGGIPGPGQLILFRRTGSALEGWRSVDGGATWIREIVATDPTFTTNLRVGLGFSIALASSPSWDDFGGGAIGTPPAPAGPPPGQSNGSCSGLGSLGLNGSRCLSDPVNTRTGSFTAQVEDLATPGTGVPFAWTRSYTSGDATVGALGPGWTHPYAATLEVQPNGDLLARGEEGQEMRYTRQEDGSFTGAAGARATLRAFVGGYELVRADQVAYAFDAQGRLVSIEDRNGQGVALAYDGQGRVQTVTDAAGRQAIVSYDPSGLISGVRTEDGRQVAYGYAAGRLTSVVDVRGKTWTYAYDAGGRLARIVDPLGHVQVTNVYAADGRVQSQTDALGKTTTFAWDPQAEIATVTDANGNGWKHDYEDGVLRRQVDPPNDATVLGHDADLNETSATSPGDQTTQMTYDAAGNLLTATAPASLGSVRKTFAYNGRNDHTQVRDARGKVTSYTYDSSGNTSSVVQDGARVAAYTYDSAGRVLTFTDGNGKRTTYGYVPATGYIASVTDPAGNETTYTYDGAGRVLTRVEPKGNVPGCGCASQFTWRYTYDASGRQLTETDPLGHVTRNAYDDAGRRTSSTDANGHTSRYTYDDADRVLAEEGPDPDGGGPLAAPVTRYAYDDVGNKRTETDPGGSTTTFGYDSANRLVSASGPDPDGSGPLAAPVTTYSYDPDGNLASTVEPRGNVSGANPDDYRTRYTYDAAGRLLTTTGPLGDVTVNVYDAVGNLASVRDANGHGPSYAYDAAGRVVTVTAPDLGVTSYTYDDAGNVLTRRDGNGHTTSFAYDDAGRLASETGPDPDAAGALAAPLTTYSYDANGNRTALTDPNGNATTADGDGRTTYGYDRANRLISIDYADGTPDVAFTYDGVGNRLTMVDGAGTETRAYDDLDRLVRTTRGQSTFSYAYDAVSNVTRRTYPDGSVADYAYDPANRLISVESGGLTTRYAYDVASNLTSTTLPSGNGYVERRVYDRAGRLIEVSSERGTTLLSRFLATLDAVGNPTRIVRSGSLPQTQTYGYDASDRLTSVCFQADSCPGAQDPFIRWSYDTVGNRLSERRPGSTTSYGYDGRDRLLSAGSVSYGYDQNGNQLSAGSRRFTYDLANRTTTTTQGNVTTTYQYDGDGVRLRASTGSQANRTTDFLWDTSFDLPQIALERDGSSNPLRRYLYGVRRISQTSGTNTSYFVYDGLGSVANLTSSSGATQWTWSYEPFGITRTETKANGNQPQSFVRFAGEYLDPTGLYHLRARQYDPQRGRFTRSDPAGQASENVAVSAYGYVANRPTVMVDPSGETFRPAGVGSEYARLTASPVDWQSPDLRCQSVSCGRRPLAWSRPTLVHPIPLGYPGSHGPKHRTDGLEPRPYWAFDFFPGAGAPVLAVQSGFIRKLSGHTPANGEVSFGVFGWSLYLKADSGSDFFYTHLGRRTVGLGDRVRAGQIVGRIGRWIRTGGTNKSHLHLGVDGGPVTIEMIGRAPRVRA